MKFVDNDSSIKMFVRVTNSHREIVKNVAEIDFSKKMMKLATTKSIQSYVFIDPTAHPHDILSTLHNNINCETQQPTRTDHLPKFCDLPQQNQSLHTLFNSYVIIPSTIRSSNHIFTLRNNRNL